MTRIYLYGNIPAIAFMNLVQMYRCLCDETRLRILHLLKQGPLCVCHFQDILQLPQVAGPSIWPICAEPAWLRLGATSNG